MPNQNAHISFANLSRFKTNYDTKLDTALATKVDKVTGKGLSTEDYTTAEKTAVSTAVQTVAVANESIVTKTGTGVSIDLSSFAKKTDISSVLKYKGTKQSASQLPATGQEVGDVWNIETADTTQGIKAGDNVAWTGTEWDILGGDVDLSGYVEKETGKGLSTNDYTDAEKTKLAGIEAGAEVNIINEVQVNSVALTPDANGAVNVDISGKVDKEQGKGLSTEDFTTALKTKLEGIEFATDNDIDGLFASAGE